MDLKRFQVLALSVSESYMEDMSRQAYVMAVATHEPNKLKDILPSNSEGAEDPSSGIDAFMRDVGSH